MQQIKACGSFVPSFGKVVVVVVVVVVVGSFFHPQREKSK
jgi:hypothetical protein